MAQVTLYPSEVDTTNSSYKQVSSSYPLSGIVGKSSSNTSTYGAGIGLTDGSNAETKVYINFDVSSIPTNVTIDSITCTVGIYGSTNVQSRTSARTIQLCKNITAVGSSTAWTVSGSTATPKITDGGSWTRAELDNLKLLVYAKRNTSNTNSNTYMYIRGADLTITYTEIISGTTYTVSVSSTSADVSVEPLGTTEVAEGSNFVVTLSPSASITDNGVDVSSALVLKDSTGSTVVSNVLGTYSLVSGSFNSAGSSYFSSSIVGNGYDGTTSSTDYYSSSSSTQAIFQYNVSFSNIPSNATITRVYVKATGKCESTSNANEYMCVQLKSGDTALTEQYNWKNSGSTSISTQTLECTTIPTVAQLSNLAIECTLGYYGGNIAGATVYVEYTTPSSNSSYTYTITSVNEDHVITISSNSSGGGGEDPSSSSSEYSYTGSVQTVTLNPGKYKLECWGAQGGNYSTYIGGFGGYSTGILTLTSKTTLYLYVGGQPAENATSQSATEGGFNGGGAGQNRYYQSVYTYGQGGGGGTDIRIGSDSLYARVIVAGGGGGSASNSTDTGLTKYGGGETAGAGGQSSSSSYNAGQSAPSTSNYYKAGTFGEGAAAYTSRTNYQCGSGGGGGGWYGGYAYNYAQDSQTDLQTYNGGGSGYVYTSATASNYPSGCLLNSSYYLTDAQTIGGNQLFPTTTTGKETGHQGNGYIKITAIVDSAATNLYIKLNNNVINVKKVYIKADGIWNEFTDLTTYFVAGKKFQKIQS